jgi:hypothetical protein
VWCKRERDWWAEAQRDPNLATPEDVPLGIAPKERIPIVRMHDTSAEWPELFVDSEKAQLVGFDFRDRGVAPLQQPLGWGLEGTEFERAVRPVMTPLLVRVVQRLNTIRERAQAWREAQEEIRRLAQPTGLTMYLHARRDQAADWERKVEELMGCGYSVVPADLDDEPRDLDRQQELRELRVQTLTGCNALLLLGAGEGRKLDRDMVLIGKEDRDSTRALRRNKVLPWGVLDLTGPPLASPLRRSTARLLQGRWLDGTRPDWCSDLQTWLAQLAAQMEQKP